MSLFGNASGSGGFSFGGSSQPQQQPQQPQQPQSGGFSFGQPSQQQQQQPQQPQQPQQSGGFSFGGASTAPAVSTAPKPSLFGAAPSTGASQPASTGFGGFGSTAGAGQQQQQQPGQQPAPSTGLFGSQQPAAPTTSSGFGGGLGGGLGGGFGQTQTQQPQQPQQSSTLGGFGGGLGGLNASQQPLNASQQPQQSNLTRTTKYNDLSDAHRKIIDDIDAHIQGRNHIALNLKSEPLGKDVDRSSVLLEQVSNDLMSLKSTLSHTSAALDSLKGDTDTDTVRALTMTRIIDGYKRPQESGAWLKTYRDFPQEYFTEMASDLKDRATKYTNTLEQIERHLRYLLSTNGQQQAMYTPHSIAQILQTQHATFMSLASHVAELQSAVDGLKDGYRDIWRSKTKSYADPFTMPTEAA
ncbi:hypothetical protein E3P99_02671 [Wallemia hederae]|uniref:Uncharacterized protein n=1 Tax=Wallemia hederae TaxID=1540922 RepID=A0A4T0FJ34_9BASI|nr:hypothetical protein E3P99_02671 [Wallemia hederae]